MTWWQFLLGWLAVSIVAAPFIGKRLRRARKAQEQEFHWPWVPVSLVTPGIWLVTCREGEDGINLCMMSEDGEWHDSAGRSTVTHHSFAPPTHWIYVSAIKPTHPKDWFNVKYRH